MTQNQKDMTLHLLNRYKSFGIEYIPSLQFNKIMNDSIDLPNCINSLEGYVNHCSLCELSKFNDTPSLGLGDVYSDIYVVGKSSDFADENIYRLLKDMFLNVLNIDISTIYLTNILKCSKNNSSQTIDSSIDICKDFIFKQIELTKPSYIITLGDAYNYMMHSDDNILDIAGNLYNFNDSKLVPLLDIEFIYKNPSYKQEMFNDLMKLKNILGQ